MGRPSLQRYPSDAVVETTGKFWDRILAYLESWITVIPPLRIYRTKNKITLSVQLPEPANVVRPTSTDASGGRYPAKVRRYRNGEMVSDEPCYILE